MPDQEDEVEEDEELEELAEEEKAALEYLGRPKRPRAAKKRGGK